jgi:hypothetical protein
MVNLSEEACQVVWGLSGDVEEIDKMASKMHSNEEESSKGNNLVEMVDVIEGNVLGNDRGSELGEPIS